MRCEVLQELDQTRCFLADSQMIVSSRNRRHVSDQIDHRSLSALVDPDGFIAFEMPRLRKKSTIGTSSKHL